VRFSVGVLVPVAVSLIMTAVATLAFVLWSAHNVDVAALDRQTRLANHVVDILRERIPHDQESVTIWDDAIVHTRQSFDVDWIDNNLGSWMYEFFGHDEVMIVDSRDQPIYTMIEGRQTSLIAASIELDALRPTLRRMRADIAAGALEAFEAGRAAHPPHVIDLMVVSGVPTLVSVEPIISDTGNIQQQRGTEYFHISMLHLDADLARRLGEEYLIPGLAFSATSPASGTASIPLADASGRFMTFLEWVPSAPGQAILNQTLPAIGGAFLVATLIALLLLGQLWRKQRDLDRGRADAAHQALHDQLTGLPNRASFEGALARILAQRPDPDRSFSLMMLDLDRFKRINDTLGHRAGDDLLEAVSQRLAQFCKPGDMLARLGGDEFGLLHLHAPGESDPLAFGNTIIEAIGKPFVIVGGEVFIGLSIGIATAGTGDADGRELARRADIALYEAKVAGRNRALLFVESMNQLLQNRHTIEAELRDALRRADQLSVAFQPLYGTGRDNIVGAEVLARWHHPRLGQIAPAHFIPVAEASGLIEALGAYVLREACRAGASWPDRIFAVNISPVQLRNPRFPRAVFDMLAETGMSPTALELEITEGVLLEEASDAAEALRMFRAAGIRIALDDFGTGYSSLNYLKRYPVDRIKIDRSFVSQLTSGSVSIAIVQAMVTLAHALGIEVTAEGVETDEQLAILTQLGCNAFQGFLLSPPVDLPTLSARFDAAPASPGPRARVA
jgi:diguanylate cyclase (GGDEF)-like protein